MTEVATGNINHEEFFPHLLYRLQGSSLECATWRLQDGRETLAMFLDEATANTYAQQAELGEGWQSFRPERSDLLEIIRQSVETGVVLATLDPDQEKAKRVFDLQAVLTNMSGERSEQ